MQEPANSTPAALPTITDRDLCARLGINLSTLYRWRQRGEAPPAYKVGARWLTREADVLEWLDQRCRVEFKPEAKAEAVAAAG